jgi:hypothetical protein
LEKRTAGLNFTVQDGLNVLKTFKAKKRLQSRLTGPVLMLIKL